MGATVESLRLNAPVPLNRSALPLTCSEDDKDQCRHARRDHEWEKGVDVLKEERAQKAEDAAPEGFRILAFAKTHPLTKSTDKAMENPS